MLSTLVSLHLRTASSVSELTGLGFRVEGFGVWGLGFWGLGLRELGTRAASTVAIYIEPI